MQTYQIVDYAKNSFKSLAVYFYGLACQVFENTPQICVDLSAHNNINSGYS